MDADHPVPDPSHPVTQLQSFRKASDKERPRRVLAIASGGGHWVQLRRLAPAFAHHDVTWVTVRRHYADDLDPGDRLLVVPDATRWDRLRLVRLALAVLVVVVRVRPRVVISTGAAPGYLAIRLGRLIPGCRTVWVDSIANCDQLSLSGRRVGPHVDLWLTQWPHLARPGGPRYEGAVL